MKSLRFGACILFVYALYYLVPLNSRLLWQPDETRYAEISREMLASGDWIVPHFLGLRYFEKPVAGYWINNIGQWLFEHNNFGVRIGVVFATTCTAMMVVWLAWNIWHDKRTALLSTVIFLTTLLVYSIGTYAVLDPIIAMWLMLAMCSFWGASRTQTCSGKISGYVVFGVACGMGVMTKGFLALVVPVISILPWIILHNLWKEVLLYSWLIAIVCLLTVLPWGLAIAQREPDFWRYFFWVEHIQRFAKSDAQHKEPFWYYVPFLIAGSLPWLGLLPGALKIGWKDNKAEQGAFYLLSWVVMPFLFFSIANGKLPTYILPCFAPLAILMARYALKTKTVEHQTRVLRINGYINVLFGLIGLMVVLLVSPYGIMSKPLWSNIAAYKCLLAAVAFSSWALVGWFSIYGSVVKRWTLVACCPLSLALLVGFAIPDTVMSSKQPQFITDIVSKKLAQSRYLMSNNVGIAACLAWELQRSDIIMFGEYGELKYGLNYPTAKDSFITKENFNTWLVLHRAEGIVSLVLHLKKGKTFEDLGLPKPDNLYVLSRMTFVQYLPL